MACYPEIPGSNPRRRSFLDPAEETAGRGVVASADGQRTHAVRHLHGALHPAGENPTLLLESDLGLIEQLDRLGYDEAWIGEQPLGGERDHRLAELFARHVMPQFQGQAESTRQAAARAQAVRAEMAGSNMAAASIEKYQTELKEKGG